jgi:hypothetical protein
MRLTLSLLFSLLCTGLLAADGPIDNCRYDVDSNDPLSTICRAMQLKQSADETTNAIATQLHVTTATASELRAAAPHIFEAQEMGWTEKTDPVLRESMASLAAIVTREPNREPVLRVMAAAAVRMKSPRAVFETIRSLLAHEQTPALALAVVNAASISPDALDVILGDALQRWPDDADVIDAVSVATYDPMMRAAFGPIAITSRGAELRHREKPLATAQLVERAKTQLDAIAAFGLPETLLAAFEALPQNVRTQLRTADANGQDIRLSLAAAEALLGRTEQARSHAAAVKPAENESGEAAAKHVILAATSPASRDPFDLAIEVFSSTFSGPVSGVTGRVFASLLEKNGYPRAAAQLLAESGPRWPKQNQPPVGAAFDAVLQPFRAQCDAAVAADDARIALLAPRQASAARSLASLLAEPRMAPFRELPLPPAAVDPSVTVIDCSENARVAATSHLPSYINPIRLERRGDEIAGIGISSAVDPVGEVGLGGYWVVHSRDGGNTWREYYTGLRPNMPYVIAPASRLPLLAGDRLQIEVSIEELDTASITFPPVDLRLLRKQSGLFLDFPIAELTRDSDEDGVTDLLEEHLVMNPRDADSDGDGIADDHDAVPQVAFGGAPSDETAVIAAALAPFQLGGGRIVTGIAEGPAAAESACDIRTSLIGSSVLFVVADPAVFAPLAIDRRTIVLSQDELDAYSKKFGPTYAAHIDHLIISRDGKRAILELNQSWAGETYLLRKTEDGWTIDRALTSWIT